MSSRYARACVCDSLVLSAVSARKMSTQWPATMSDYWRKTKSEKKQHEFMRNKFYRKFRTVLGSGSGLLQSKERCEQPAGLGELYHDPKHTRPAQPGGVKRGG